MRAARIPAFLLLALAVLALAHSAAMERRCRGWLETVAQAEAAAARERWEEADRLLEDLERDWDGCRVLMRTTVCHESLNQARVLLGQARLRCRLRDAPETRAALAELEAQLRQIAADERLGWENIL